MVRILFCLTCCFLAFANLGLAQDCVELDDYIHTLSRTNLPPVPGYYPRLQDIVVYQDTMFMAIQYGGIASAVINSDETISFLSVIPAWSGQPRALVARNDFLYVADGTAGLLIYDISDATSIQWLAHIDTPGNAVDVDIIYDRALILDDFMGLVVIDIHEVRSPHIIATVEVPGVPTQMQRSGDLLFIACGSSGLAVVDISFPDMPRLTEVIEFPNGIRNIAVGGNVLAVTPRSFSSTEIIFFKIGQSQPLLTLESSLMMVSGYSINIEFFGDLLLVSGFEYGIHAINTSVLSEPYIQAYHHSTATIPSVFTLLNGYLVTGYYGLELVDFDPVATAPIVREIPLEGDVRWVAVDENHVYVAGNEPRLQVVDISNMDAPNLIDPIPEGICSYLTVHNGFLYLAGYYGDLEIYSLENPLYPVMVNSLDDTRYVKSIVFQDNLMVVIFNHVMFLFNATNPAALELYSSVSLSWGLHADVQGNYIYVASDSRGLKVYDIFSPSYPSLVFELEESGFRPRAVDAVGDFLYLVNNNQDEGFHVFNISSPASPELIATLPLPSVCHSCFEIDGYVYAHSDSGPIIVIDVNDPYYPEIAGKYGNHGSYEGVVANDDFLILLGDYTGLEVGLLHCPTVTAVHSSPDWLQPSPLKIYPNPFNPRTNIEWSNSQPGMLEVSVFDMAGRRVALLADKAFSAGGHTLQWDGSGDTGAALPSGVYLVTVRGEEFIFSQRISLIR